VRDPFVLSRVVLWTDWLSQAIPRVLVKNAKDLGEIKINRHNIEKELSKKEERPWPEQTLKKVKRFAQRKARTMLNKRATMRTGG